MSQEWEEKRGEDRVNGDWVGGCLGRLCNCAETSVMEVLETR